MLGQLEGYPSEALTGKVGAEFIGIVDDIAKRNVALRRYDVAEEGYTKVISLLDEITGIDERLRKTGKASAYHQLGIVAQEQWRWAEAEQYFQKALAIRIEFNDRYEQAGTYLHLGVVAQKQRRWAEAEQHYRKALEILVEFNDRYGRAATYHQLGIVAEEQRHWAEARDYFLKDLEISVEFNDQPGAAMTLQSLARLWQASGDDGMPGAVATRLGITPEEATELLNSARDD